MAPKKPIAKTKGPPKPIIAQPMLLVLHEKHGNHYFHIKDDSELFRVALDILTKRASTTYWYYDPRLNLPTNPGMTMAQADKLPEGPIRASAQRTVLNYENAVRRCQNEIEDWNDLQKAVKEKDGRLAWHVLRMDDSEYARVSLEPYMTAY